MRGALDWQPVGLTPKVSTERGLLGPLSEHQVNFHQQSTEGVSGTKADYRGIFENKKSPIFRAFRFRHLLREHGVERSNHSTPTNKIGRLGFSETSDLLLWARSRCVNLGPLPDRVQSPELAPWPGRRSGCSHALRQRRRSASKHPRTM